VFRMPYIMFGWLIFLPMKSILFVFLQYSLLSLFFHLFIPFFSPHIHIKSITYQFRQADCYTPVLLIGAMEPRRDRRNEAS
jgi:hypothetical protein